MARRPISMCGCSNCFCIEALRRERRCARAFSIPHFQIESAPQIAHRLRLTSPPHPTFRQQSQLPSAFRHSWNSKELPDSLVLGCYLAREERSRPSHRQPQVSLSTPSRLIDLPGCCCGNTESLRDAARRHKSAASIPVDGPAFSR